MSNVSTQFKKGQSGNIKGRPPRDWTWSGILEEVGEEIEPKSKKKFKDLVSRKLWIKAVNGDLVAIKEIFNRMDGMPAIKGEIDANVNLTIDRDLEKKE